MREMNDGTGEGAGTMRTRGGWEAVIGVEVHVQLRTEEKLFTADGTLFGEDPNTQISPVSLGLPGALPVLNREAVRLAYRTGAGFFCTLHPTSIFARKNYFYPDLPKGYQISQFDRPFATDGTLDAEVGEEGFTVRIRRIHMEEDAGKSIHDRIPGATAVDLNRAGMPLAEIVTEPDLRTPKQVRAWLGELKRVLEYLDVSDCSMEEGSLRVDANVSIREVGSDRLNTKTELKNMNSFSNVERALEVEIARQIALVEEGGAVRQESLLWDPVRGEVRPMRSKEESHDYRYFPDPDLPPLHVPEEEIARIEGELPELPRAREARFRTDYALPAYDASVLTAERVLADYFEAVVDRYHEPKVVSNWIMGPLLALAKEIAGGFELLASSLSPEAFAELLRLQAAGTVTPAAARRALAGMAETGEGAAVVIEREGLAVVQDADALEGWVSEALAAHPEEVARWRGGEGKLLGFFMGEVMKRAGGRADAKEVGRRLREALSGEE